MNNIWNSHGTCTIIGIAAKPLGDCQPEAQATIDPSGIGQGPVEIFDDGPECPALRQTGSSLATLLSQRAKSHNRGQRLPAFQSSSSPSTIELWH